MTNSSEPNLERTGLSTQELPTVQEMNDWDAEKVFRWVQQRDSNILEEEDLDNFKTARITGSVFLLFSVKRFQNCGLPLAVAVVLKNLANKVKRADELSNQTAGRKRKGDETDASEPSISPKRNRHKEANQSPNQKRLGLSVLPGSGAIYETESAENHSHLFFPADAEFSNFFNKPNAIVIDKTHFIPLLEKDPFRYMFLRPRRWGKSTFLNMLAAYYDVETRDSFEEVFGGLSIGKAPTKSRNSHLILLFDFSMISPSGSVEKIERQLFGNVSETLRDFLHKYRDILGDALPEKYIIPGLTAPSLMNVLNLVYASGYTAFVGVDEYDAPANTCLMAALRNRNVVSRSYQRIDSLDSVFKAQFFSVIKRACGRSVEKYWVTGVLPAFRDDISPLTGTEVITFDERYNSLCGLTQEDVNAIVERALPESERANTLASLKLWYSGYMFGPPSPGSENHTVYNPQLVFVHLRKLLSRQVPSSYIDEANAVHTATVLSIIGETGFVTISDLINMLYEDITTPIMKELSFVEVMPE